MIQENKQAKKEKKTKKTLANAFLAFSLFVFSFIVFNIALMVIKNYNENIIINNLKAKIEKSEKNNNEIRKMVEEQSKNSNKEKFARESLNLSKDGENVIFINDNKTEIKIDDIDKNKENLKNYKKWFNYFFNK